ncbi:endonuclease exonuclease phosphatase domain containing protein [Elysia marginata]|uniref:Endonuclease exonuclease phosphatase domain containing protein n=1 Tax=Elysia marginata TaxID=1093978 RepID=A0AAV4GBM7_9GAST|nr:endonuclease exonuclease phosphatase domain containing protein [Elysia marginata]
MQAEQSRPGIMTDGIESREEAFILTTELLTPKQPTKIGFGDVRTLYHTDNLAQTSKEKNNYILKLLGVAEARYKTGQQRLDIGEITIWSRGQGDKHQEGVELILSKIHA